MAMLPPGEMSPVGTVFVAVDVATGARALHAAPLFELH